MFLLVLSLALFVVDVIISYKQQKYNLFREESEGYAKLVTELNQDLTTVTPVEVMKVKSTMVEISRFQSSSLLMF